MRLTPHFHLSEFTDSQTAARKGVNNVPSARDRVNLERLARMMEQVRTILDNNPILISSGYRSPAVNTAVGGSKNSQHMQGLAVDFTCPEYGTPLLVCKALRNHMVELEIDQLIYEFESWVHLGLTDGRPRYQALTIDSKGTRSGF